jgi:hypothetical protein
MVEKHACHHTCVVLEDYFIILTGCVLSSEEIGWC